MSGRLPRHARRLVKLLRLLGDPVFRHGLRFGVGAAIEHRAVIAPMALETVVDVGANVGQFSLLVRALHPRARIVAFEPLARAAARYRRVFARDPGAALHEAAVAPRPGVATLHLSASPDSSSLLPITERQSALFPGTEAVGTLRVEAGPLDAFVTRADLAPPALLKIDVQGFELEVLRASLSLLAAFDWVYVEASCEELYEGQALAGEVAAFLAGHGFAEAGRCNVVRDRDGKPVQADFLFRRTAGPAQDDRPPGIGSRGSGRRPAKRSSPSWPEFRGQEAAVHRFGDPVGHGLPMKPAAAVPTLDEARHLPRCLYGLRGVADSVTVCR